MNQRLPRNIRLAVFSILLVSAFSSWIGCSGGGGGDDDPESQLPFSNFCEAIGLKIFNGQQCFASETSAGTAVVRIRIFNAQGLPGVCSGTLVTPGTVLTAAHCFMEGVSGIFVDTIFSEEQVVQIIPHPGFRIDPDRGIFNDVAVVRIARDLDLPTIPLATNNEAQIGDEALVAGVGLNESGELGAIEAGRVVIDNVTVNHIFTSFDSSSESNPCKGDSGGPLLVVSPSGALSVAGVVSTGIAETECREGDVTLYTNLSDPPVKEFLEQSIGL